jgi:ABC-type transport system involved in multi-copper enzyme maturation permease subunit
MNLPAALYAFRWLARDTFRQAMASGLFWLMLGVSGLVTLVCLSVGVAGGAPLHRPGETAEFIPANDPQANSSRIDVHGVDVISGELTIGFGAFRVPLGRDAPDAVRFLQLILAGGVADAAGVLLALVWTAGFLPGFLDPSTAAVVLAKPVPRWGVLLGKYLGVVAFVGFQAAVFVGGTWLALGVRTGVWDTHYLLCVPLLLLHFGVFYAVSALLAVCTRSTAAVVFGVICAWVMCWGMNFGRHLLVAQADAGNISPGLQWAVEAGYWVLPKPADLSLVLFDALQADNSFTKAFEYYAVQTKGAFHPELSVLTSLLFAAVMLAVAARELSTTDY